MSSLPRWGEVPKESKDSHYPIRKLQKRNWQAHREGREKPYPDVPHVTLRQDAGGKDTHASLDEVLENKGLEKPKGWATLKIAEKRSWLDAQV